jgi:RNA ligase (TIGR02306 family)
VYSHTEKLGELVEGEDYSEALGVTKYEPPIPSEMSGRVEHKPGLYSYTDIENIKYFPQVLSEDEEVVASEKIHGSCTILCRFPDGEFVVSSKGLASKQLALITERNSDGVAVNIYHRVGEAFGISTILDALSERWPGQTLTLFGETLGVQDLMYGLPKGELDLKFFDLRVGDRYLDYDEFVSICQEFDLPRPNELYRGPYDRVKLEEVASGREQVTGKEVHLREGVVVRPAHERRDNELGRVILKVISPAYLTKRGDEATEFE